MKHGKSIKSILLKVLLVLLVLALLACGTFLAVREAGRRALLEKNASASMALELEAAEEEEDYQEGDVRYKGEVYRYNDDVMTFLIMGIDSDKKLPRPENVWDYTKGGQADALFLVVANMKSEEISIVNINRNAMAEVDIYDKNNEYITTKLQQISLQHGYGSGLEDSCERQVKAVSELFFKLPIDGYAAINMGAIAGLNDAVGGVQLELLQQIPYPYGSSVLRQPIGTMVTLNGKDAYVYVRHRGDAFDSASKRLMYQRQYLNAFSAQLVEKLKTDITFLGTLYNTVKDYLVTDVSLAQASFLASEMLDYTFNMGHITLMRGETVMGDDGFEEFYADDEALYDLVIRLFYDKVS